MSQRPSIRSRTPLKQEVHPSSGESLRRTNPRKEPFSTGRMRFIESYNGRYWQTAQLRSSSPNKGLESKLT